MNVYDFDKTIYDGDCSIDFIIYLTKKHPRFLKYYPSIFMAYGKYKWNKISKLQFKSIFFKMIQNINLSLEVKLFWDNNEIKIKDWYLQQKKETDLIISASPEFLISEICKRLKVNYLASKVDEKTGVYQTNFYGDEKVVQWKKYYKGKKINEFYSDSISDLPLAKEAKTAFLVHKNNRRKWDIK